MKIIVDADACPVKDIVISESANRNIDVTLVSSLSHFSNKDLQSHVNHIYVDAGRDAADFKIVQLAKKGDLIITQDYGLASLLLPKGCKVMHHTGFEYDKNNMDHLLESRYMGAMVRKSGGRTKGPKAFTEAERQTFKAQLNEILDQY